MGDFVEEPKAVGTELVGVAVVLGACVFFCFFEGGGVFGLWVGTESAVGRAVGRALGSSHAIAHVTTGHVPVRPLEIVLANELISAFRLAALTSWKNTGSLSEPFAHAISQSVTEQPAS